MCYAYLRLFPVTECYYSIYRTPKRLVAVSNGFGSSSKYYVWVFNIYISSCGKRSIDSHGVPVRFWRHSGFCTLCTQIGKVQVWFSESLPLSGGGGGTVTFPFPPEQLIICHFCWKVSSSCSNVRWMDDCWWLCSHFQKMDHFYYLILCFGPKITLTAKCFHTMNSQRMPRFIDRVMNQFTIEIDPTFYELEMGFVELTREVFDDFSLWWERREN